MDTSNKQLSIDNALYSSTVEVIKKVSPTNSNVEKQNDLSAVLNDLFPEQLFEEKNFHASKLVLGDLAAELSLQELQCAIAEIQYLSESWLDDFEREIFNGLTLKEMLHEKGG